MDKKQKKIEHVELKSNGEKKCFGRPSCVVLWLLSVLEMSVKWVGITVYYGKLRRGMRVNLSAAGLLKKNMKRERQNVNPIIRKKSYSIQHWNIQISWSSGWNTIFRLDLVEVNLNNINITTKWIINSVVYVPPTLEEMLKEASILIIIRSERNFEYVIHSHLFLEDSSRRFFSALSTFFSCILPLIIHSSKKWKE